MGKILLLFKQSDTVDVYVNVLTHCIKEEKVREIYFIGDEVTAERNYELAEFVDKIKNRIIELAKTHSEYEPVRDMLPQSVRIQDRIIRIPFTRPQEAIPKIKKQFPDYDNLLIDISSCKKRLASDVMTSYMAQGINHICHFELSDKVYSLEWKNSGRSRLYHDLKSSITDYYQYDDFSQPGTTISSFKRLRAQGTIIKVLLGLSFTLGFAVIILINSQQTTFAQITALLLAVTTGLGFLEDSFSFSERLKK